MSHSTTPPSTPIVFFGNERLASGVATSAPILNSLIQAEYSVGLVVVNQASDVTGRRERQLEILHVATQHNIPVHVTHTTSELASAITATGAQLGVLAAYGKIVPQSILDLFPHGIINIHPSALPAYRGSTPIESAMLAGDQFITVSVMRLVAAMDAGPIYAQDQLNIQGATKQDITDRVGSLGAELLQNTLPGVLDDSIQPTEQDHAAATFTKQIAKADSVIDWHKSAEQLEREVRAYLGWPGSFTTLYGRDVVITRAHVSAESGTPGKTFHDKKTLGVYCSQGSLIIDELKPAGKATMSGADFARGYGN